VVQVGQAHETFLPKYTSISLNIPKEKIQAFARTIASATTTIDLATVPLRTHCNFVLLNKSTIKHLRQ
jgi:hypothetical protein